MAEASVWGEDPEDKDSTTHPGRTGVECVCGQGRGGKGGLLRLRGAQGQELEERPSWTLPWGHGALGSLWPPPTPASWPPGWSPLLGECTQYGDSAVLYISARLALLSNCCFPSTSQVGWLVTLKSVLCTYR